MEAQISESPWITENLLPHWPPRWRPDQLSLGSVRSAPALGLTQAPAVLQGETVSAWIRQSLLDSRGARTATLRVAARKRREYRTFLSWAHDHKLCGGVAETLLDGTLRDLTGTYLWLDPLYRIGNVRRIQGVAIDGGPLDAAGEWPLDPSRLSAGAIPFGVEVKNIRAPIYPWSIEAWDLLAKMCAIPDAIPILVARRIHLTTFRFFKDIGALGSEFRQQMFSTAIPSGRFNAITGALSLHNARQVDPEYRLPSLLRFFERDGPALAADQRAKWAIAAPIVARYADYRETGDRHRWVEFCREVIAAGLHQTEGWAPQVARRPHIEYEPEEDDRYDAYDLYDDYFDPDAG